MPPRPMPKHFMKINTNTPPCTMELLASLVDPSVEEDEPLISKRNSMSFMGKVASWLLSGTGIGTSTCITTWDSLKDDRCLSPFTKSRNHFLREATLDREQMRDNYDESFEEITSEELEIDLEWLRVLQAERARIEWGPIEYPHVVDPICPSWALAPLIESEPDASMMGFKGTAIATTEVGASPTKFDDDNDERRSEFPHVESRPLSAAPLQRSRDDLPDSGKLFSFPPLSEDLCEECETRSMPHRPSAFEKRGRVRE